MPKPFKLKAMLNYFPVNFDEMSASELCEYIAKRHHGFIREEMDKIKDHLKTATQVDSGLAPELKEIVQLFARVREEIEQHFRREEKILFPFIRSLTADKKFSDEAEPAAKLIEKPLDEMNEDHRLIGLIFSEIRTLSRNYFQVPESSPTHKLCYEELIALEEDLEKQFYVEEKILTPKLIALEQELLAGKNKSNNTNA